MVQRRGRMKISYRKYYRIQLQRASFYFILFYSSHWAAVYIFRYCHAFFSFLSEISFFLCVFVAELFERKERIKWTLLRHTAALCYIHFIFGARPYSICICILLLLLLFKSIVYFYTLSFFISFLFHRRLLFYSKIKTYVRDDENVLNMWTHYTNTCTHSSFPIPSFFLNYLLESETE